MAGVAGRDIDHVELENTDAGGKGEEKLVSRSLHDDAFSNVWPAIKYDLIVELSMHDSNQVTHWSRH